MKPIRLEMRNIGPYAHEIIDFERLENIFLICGNTGAGKTFIFDAMTFALYGDLSGNRGKGKAVNIASRYASEKETEFYVDFTFSCRDEIYEIRRGVKNNKVELKKKVDGKFIPVSEKMNKTEAAEQIGKILGLTLEEFSQIILLPQGAFAEFLRKNSTQRRGMLEKLFPVTSYSRIMELVYEKKEILQKKQNDHLAVLKNEMADGKDFSDGEKTLKAMEEAIKKLEAVEKKFLEEREKLASDITKLNGDYEAAVDHENDVKKLQELQAMEGEINLKESAVIQGEKAEELKVFFVQKGDAKDELSDRSEDLTEAVDELEKAEKVLKALEEKSREMKEVEDSLKPDQIELSGLDDKIKKAEDILKVSEEVESLSEKFETETENKAKLEKALEEMTKLLGGKKVEALLSELSDVMLEVQNQLNAGEKAVEEGQNRDKLVCEKAELEEKGKAQKADFEEKGKEFSRLEETVKLKKEQVEEFNKKHSSYILSQTLKTGCACPVCGSIEHPSPAKKQEGLLDPSEELKTFETALKTAQTVMNEADRLWSETKTKIAEKEKQLNAYAELSDSETLYKNLEAIKDKDEECKQKKNLYLEVQEKSGELKEQLDDCTGELKTLEVELKNKKDEKVRLEKEAGGDLEALVLRKEELSEKISRNEEIVNNFKKELEESKENKAACVKDKDSKKTALDKALEKLKKAETLLAEKVSESIFNSVEAAENAFIESDDLTQLRKEVTDYKAEVKSLQDAISKAKKLEASETIKNALGEVQNKQNDLQSQYEKNHQQLEEKKTDYISFRDSYDKYYSAMKKSEELAKELEPYEKLNKDLSGKNPAGVPFDMWALGLYFEQIVNFASARFFKISDGRFEFVMRDLADKQGGGNKGLDLQILDHSTESLCETTDLSGGETFEASISLALAITDVVQHNTGGIQLDSLFIDEGFGTLDPEPLEKAMSVFTELSESKMIGIISHVESLRSEDSGISSQIKVKKTNRGSTIEI